MLLERERDEKSPVPSPCSFSSSSTVASSLPERRGVVFPLSSPFPRRLYSADGDKSTFTILTWPPLFPLNNDYKNLWNPNEPFLPWHVCLDLLSSSRPPSLPPFLSLKWLKIAGPFSYQTKNLWIPLYEVNFLPKLIKIHWITVVIDFLQHEEPRCCCHSILLTQFVQKQIK